MTTIENPIINSPFEEPTQHWVIDATTGQPSGELASSRRRSETWVPVPRSRKQVKHNQAELPFDSIVSEPRSNTMIGEIRRVVGLWRQGGYQHVTPTTRRLLEYWTRLERGTALFFAQLEAVETAIYLTEVRDKLGEHWITDYLGQQNAEHNAGLPRVALKMATGTGKTVVMAMLIAWHTLNKVASPQDARFAKRFLLVVPGVTIRDRLRVLLPADDANYYRQMDLVPSDLWPALRQAQMLITNYHSFMLKTTKEGQSIASLTKKLLLAKSSSKDDPFTETPAMMVNRVVKDLGGSGKGQIIVINDEAHHCYQERTDPVDEAETVDSLRGDEKKEAQEENENARRWFIGLQQIAAKIGIKTIYDLSATPQFLKGSGYPEGYLFPWVVSDFSLMDAIESGLVKIPRVPVDDDAPGQDVVYLNLWTHISADLPKRVSRDVVMATHSLPPILEGALKSLYGNYTKAFEAWAASQDRDDTTPPVFIVVCSNTLISKWIYDKIAGYHLTDDAGDTLYVQGDFALFSNVENGSPLSKPRTIIVDSRQLESGEQINAEFKAAAEDEIQQFRAEYAMRYPGRDGSGLTDADLLREVLNTVGKKGRLGEGIRCVVSVSMLTEGWDANTVTHILGVRAFSSHLLCEQVVGRGLRRTSYAIGDDGLFEPEYADVYGVPFSFIQTDPEQVLDPKPKPIPKRVKAMLDRPGQRISFPKLDGYRVEVEDPDFIVDFTEEEKFHVDSRIPTTTHMSGIVGEQTDHTLADSPEEKARVQEVAFTLAKDLLDLYRDPTGGPEAVALPQIGDVGKRVAGYLRRSAPSTNRSTQAHRSMADQSCGNAAPRLAPQL